MTEAHGCISQEGCKNDRQKAGHIHPGAGQQPHSQGCVGQREARKEKERPFGRQPEQLPRRASQREHRKSSLAGVRQTTVLCTQLVRFIPQITSRLTCGEQLFCVSLRQSSVDITFPYSGAVESVKTKLPGTSWGQDLLLDQVTVCFVPQQYWGQGATPSPKGGLGKDGPQVCRGAGEGW